MTGHEGRAGGHGGGDLEGELEQALVALEDAREEAARLDAERDRLVRALDLRDRLLAEADQRLRGRQDAARVAEDRWTELSRGEVEHAAMAEELQVAMEELQAMAEELGTSNEALRQANEGLEARVAARTAELEAANAALVRAERDAREANQAKSRFLAAASHDLRQPVTAATLYLDLLERRATDPALKDLVGMVAMSLEGLRGLLNGLLDMARLEAGVVEPRPEPFALDDLLQRLASEYEGVARAGRLWLQVPPTPHVVRSDRLLLELVLRNLVSNAIKYTRRGGVDVTCRPDGALLRVDVSDTGIGIPAEALHRIFDDFYQADTPARGQGYGIGLATVQRAAKLLGCRLDVRSVPGEGSTFSVWVPVAEVAAVPAGPAPAGDPALGGPVLLVDDEVMILDAMDMLLSDWGLEVEAACGVAEAAGRVRGRREPYALVLTDYQLGDGDGLEVVRLARSLGPTPAILLTGDTNPAVLGGAGLPDLHVLHKPAESVRLKALLASLAPSGGMAARQGGAGMTGPRRRGQEGAELEELRAGLEAALAENGALAADLAAAREQAARRARADLEEIRARDALVQALRDRLAGLGRDPAAEACLAESFQVAMEEAQVATEELEAANDSLRRMVAELEARVAERTAALEAALLERDRLRHALGERVRRGLWLAGSFFRPWSFHPGIGTPAARRQVQGRLEALCQALALLDGGGEGHRVDMATYVRSLCEGLGDSLDPAGPGTEVRCEVPAGLGWDVGLALTLGLVVNELVADALRRRPANAGDPVTVAVRPGPAGDCALVSVAPGARAPVPAAGPALAALLAEVGGALREEAWPRPATIVTLPASLPGPYQRRPTSTTGASKG